jgi:subtilisin-like proprotein convertase family protein
MNQDRDGVNGEPIDDQYHAQFTLTDQLTFAATDTPQYIDWFWSALSSITIGQDVAIGDLNVTLNITHPFEGDLALYLIGPDGTTIALSQFNGDGANFSDTTFDDQASISIAAGSAPFAGSYQPEEPLSTFNGENARGTWTLEVDNWGFETGWLNSWSMSILPGSGTLPPPPPPPPPPDNQPPTAVDDFAVTDEDTPTTIDVLANDSDPEGDPLTVTSIDWTSGGSATINADQTVTFTPDPDFNGDASFGYSISDGFNSASAVATIMVNPVNDPPVANNDLFNAVRDTPLTVYEWDLTSNDTDADGDYLSVVGVANATNGQVTLDSGTITFTPNPGFAGWAGFDYVVTDGQAFATAHVDINVRSVYYFSSAAGGTLTNSDGSKLAFTNTDIVSLAVNADGTYQYQMFFNGRDVGLTTTSERIDAFTFLDDGTIVVSTAGSFSVPTGYGGGVSGVGQDLIRFTPWSLGDNTSGSWEMYFDGSDVGLTTTAENIDAVAVLPDGRILLSTAGAFSVPGVSTGGQAEDLLAFTPNSLGTATSGTWAMYFDGSDVGLSGTAENMDGLFVQASPTGGLPTLYFSTAGSFSVPGLAGGRSDILAFQPTTLGTNTTGTFTSPLTLAASTVGLASFNIDGLALGVAPSQYLAGDLAVHAVVPKTIAKTTNASTIDLGQLFAELPSDWSLQAPTLTPHEFADSSVQAIWDWLVYEASNLPKKVK